MNLETKTLEKIIKSLSEEELKLISIISRYTVTKREANRSSIQDLIDIKLPSIAEKWEDILNELVNKRILGWEKDTATFTQQGEEIAKWIYNQDHLTKYFYDEFYKAAEESMAHGKLCEKVYGRNFCQHGMTDMKQLELLIEQLKNSKSENILELGCGSGYITEYVSEKLNVNITGIDISNKSIEAAKARTISKGNKLKFEATNIYDLDYPEGSFDTIFAIDSLFMVNPFENVVEKLNKFLTPNGIMYIFYIYPPDTTVLRLNEELDRLHIKYEMTDLSRENYEHWKLKEITLEELREEFDREGNSFLYNNRMTECKYELCNFKRYLYKCYKRS